MNIIGTVIVVSLIGVSIYAILILIAISPRSQDLLWTIGFIIQFAQNFFIADPVLCLLKLGSLLTLHSSYGELSTFRKILFLFYKGID
jgi:hypothetical protein